MASWMLPAAFELKNATVVATLSNFNRAPRMRRRRRYGRLHIQGSALHNGIFQCSSKWDGLAHDTIKTRPAVKLQWSTLVGWCKNAPVILLTYV